MESIIKSKGKTPNHLVNMFSSTPGTTLIAMDLTQIWRGLTSREWKEIRHWKL